LIILEKELKNKIKKYLAKSNLDFTESEIDFATEQFNRYEPFINTLCDDFKKSGIFLMSSFSAVFTAINTLPLEQKIFVLSQLLSLTEKELASAYQTQLNKREESK
jgi:hypothetical protein